MNNYIKKRINSIILVIMFLVLSTMFFYLPKQAEFLSSMAFLNAQSSFYVEDLSKGITLNDAYPIEDVVGLKYEPYTFKIVNNTNKTLKYKIIFSNNLVGDNILDNKYIRYSLSNIDDTNLVAYTLNDDGVILITTLDSKSEEIFNFRMWLDYNSDSGASGKRFSGTIKIEKIK